MNFDELQKMRQDNIGRFLQRAARDYSELALAKLEQRGHGGLTLFHTTLISYLDMDGTQISVLAERAGVSKQAMGQIAKELEERQYVMRISDPNDKRAVLLQFMPLGMQFLQDAYQVKLEIEAEYTQILGEANFALLRQLLSNLLERD